MPDGSLAPLVWLVVNRVAPEFPSFLEGSLTSSQDPTTHPPEQALGRKGCQTLANTAWGPSPGSDLKRLGQVTGCWVGLICWLSLSPHLSQVRQGSPGVLVAQTWAPGWELGGPLSTTSGAHTQRQALPTGGPQAPGRQGRR